MNWAIASAIWRNLAHEFVEEVLIEGCIYASSDTQTAIRSIDECWEPKSRFGA